MATTEKDESAFDYFKESDRVEELTEKFKSRPIVKLIMDVRDGDQEALVYLVSKSLRAIKSGYLLNKILNGREHDFLSALFKKLIMDTRKETGPFWTVDILDSNDKDQLEQLGIEFYTYSKTLDNNDLSMDGVFDDNQTTHPLSEEKGLFEFIRKISPEYAQILSHMVHYTPSDEIVQEMELTGLSTLKAKIRSIRTLVDHYYQKEDKRDDNYMLSKN